MRNVTKIWLAIAASSILLGGALFVTAGCSVHWDANEIGTVNHITNTHVLNENVENFSIETSTANVSFLLSSDESTKVVCLEDEKRQHAVSMENGTLTIKETDNRAWYDHISFMDFGNTSVTVYLPKKEYATLAIDISTGDINIAKNLTFDSINVSGSTCDVACYASVKNDLNIEVSTGDITLKEIFAGSVSLTASTGDIEVASVDIEKDFKVSVSTGERELRDITCKNLTTTASTGDLEMKNVLATQKMHIEGNSSDVNFTSCDAAEIYIKTSTGDVTGSLRTMKDFHAEASTGDVNVPHSSVGGKCIITCSTGDITITVLEIPNN